MQWPLIHDSLSLFVHIFEFVSDRLLTLWFDFGHYDDVYEALVEGLKTIHIDNWLQVQFLVDPFSISVQITIFLQLQ